MSLLSNEQTESPMSDMADTMANELESPRSDRPLKRKRRDQVSIDAERAQSKAELENLFTILSLSNETSSDDNTRKMFMDKFACDGVLDIDQKAFRDFSNKFSLDYAGQLNADDVIVLLQRAQNQVQMNRSQARASKSSMPKAVKNFILVILTIVSKSNADLVSDINYSIAQQEIWHEKTKNMDDSAAEKVKLDTHGVTGEFLITETSKRAYIGMLNETDRFKSNYVYLTKFLSKHKIIAEVEPQNS